MKTQCEHEIWKDIPNEEDYYQVSNLGRVRSKDRIVRHNCGGDKLARGKLLSQLILPNGYCQVSLWREGERKIVLVHRLVLLAFVGECPHNAETRHLNSIRSDNRLCNLAYGTHSENVIDTINLGRNGRQKFNPQIVREIRERADNGETIKKLAEEYGCSTESIRKIKRRITYAWLQ